METLSVMRKGISIHALRVEGDSSLQDEIAQSKGISIHALRVEGDREIFPEF